MPAFVDMCVFCRNKILISDFLVCMCMDVLQIHCLGSYWSIWFLKRLLRVIILFNIDMGFSVVMGYFLERASIVEKLVLVRNKQIHVYLL